MATSVKINNEVYPAVIAGRMTDPSWDNRASKSITLEMEHDVALEIFHDGTVWFIVDGEEEFNNADYSIAGDITDHRDGTLTVKMGKPTDLEDLLEMIYGGDEE